MQRGVKTCVGVRARQRAGDKVRGHGRELCPESAQNAELAEFAFVRAVHGVDRLIEAESVSLRGVKDERSLADIQRVRIGVNVLPVEFKIVARLELRALSTGLE